MKSVDTNIVVRRITRDDPLQTPLADVAFQNPVYIATGVLLETEWVLRSVYGWPRERILNALASLANVESVTIDDPDGFSWAIIRCRAGADWADMLHIVASRKMEAFVTFEKQLPRRAGPDAPVPIEVLPGS